MLRVGHPWTRRAVEAQGPREDNVGVAQGLCPGSLRKMSALSYKLNDSCGPWKERGYVLTGYKPLHPESSETACVSPERRGPAPRWPQRLCRDPCPAPPRGAPSGAETAGEGRAGSCIGTTGSLSSALLTSPTKLPKWGRVKLTWAYKAELVMV